MAGLLGGIEAREKPGAGVVVQRSVQDDHGQHQGWRPSTPRRRARRRAGGPPGATGRGSGGVGGRRARPGRRRRGRRGSPGGRARGSGRGRPGGRRAGGPWPATTRLPRRRPSGRRGRARRRGRRRVASRRQSSWSVGGVKAKETSASCLKRRQVPLGRGGPGGRGDVGLRIGSIRSDQPLESVAEFEAGAVESAPDRPDGHSQGGRDLLVAEAVVFLHDHHGPVVIGQGIERRLDLRVALANVRAAGSGRSAPGRPAGRWSTRRGRACRSGATAASAAR